MWKKNIYMSKIALCLLFTTVPPLQASAYAQPKCAEDYLHEQQLLEVKKVTSDDQQLEAHPIRVALVLGGGGLRGVAHIGVLKVLEREKIPVDMVVGTSMGAIIGGLYCAGAKTDDLGRVIVKRFISTFYEAPLSIQIVKMNLGLLFFQKPQGVYSGNRLAKRISRRLPANMREISQFKTPFAAVATDLLTGSTIVINNGDIAKVLQATSAIPVLKNPVNIGDYLLVDGGIVCNLPVEEAKRLGADFVIAVDVDEKIVTSERSVYKRNIGKISSRVLSLVLAKLDSTQMAKANFCIQPDTTGISLLSHKKSDGKRAIQAGEMAANKALPELKRQLAIAGVKLSN